MASPYFDREKPGELSDFLSRVAYPDALTLCIYL
jgi:hypothetical protein